MRRKFSLLFILLLLIYPTTMTANSLWTEQSGSYFIKPVRQFAVGELLTIIISEQTSATSRTGANTGEESSVVVGPGAGILTNLLPYLQGSVESSYGASAGTNKTGSLKAQLTVRIVAIDEHGNLSFEGSKEIKVNEDVQRLTFVGTVRSEDVRPDNTVYSTYVAEARIDYLGDDHATKKGFLTRAFDWLF
ncbi:MAG: flagellar basal body L-ring protein FlgH [Firmicutes bacterium]|nr:flagellar basal body L-ring protein FlgH [Bacillota bacterium]